MPPDTHRMPDLEAGKLTTDIQRHASEVKPTISTISPNPNRGSALYSGNYHPRGLICNAKFCVNSLGRSSVRSHWGVLGMHGAGDGSHSGHNFVPRVKKFTPPHLACCVGPEWTKTWCTITWYTVILLKNFVSAITSKCLSLDFPMLTIGILWSLVLHFVSKDDQVPGKLAKDVNMEMHSLTRETGKSDVEPESGPVGMYQDFSRRLSFDESDVTNYAETYFDRMNGIELETMKVPLSFENHLSCRDHVSNIISHCLCLHESYHGWQNSLKTTKRKFVYIQWHAQELNI